MIDGNIEAVFQEKRQTGRDAIGSRIYSWVDITEPVTGFLDLASGEADYSNNAKLEQSTHIFICDYVELNFTSENTRVVINSVVYEIMLIDDPMELHEQLEIYLKYTGVVVN